MGQILSATNISCYMLPTVALELMTLMVNACGSGGANYPTIQLLLYTSTNWPMLACMSQSTATNNHTNYNTVTIVH